MKLLNLNRVLCLSPHPDDVEYSMLGTIIKHQDTIFDVLFHQVKTQCMNIVL